MHLADAGWKRQVGGAMFTYPRNRIRNLGAALAATILAATAAQARIGDTPDQMSQRMLQPNLGKNFSWPRDMGERERARQEGENPLKAVAHLLPKDDWREQMFWKSAVRGQLNNENGWRINVYYFRGRSSVEIYRRVGHGLSEFEVSAILALLRGGETWRKVTRKENVATVLGYDFELGDESSPVLRARQQGDALMLFHPRFDAMLVEAKTRWDATEAERREVERKEQAERAPDSVIGF